VEIEYLNHLYPSRRIALKMFVGPNTLFHSPMMMKYAKKEAESLAAVKAEKEAAAARKAASAEKAAALKKKLELKRQEALQKAKAKAAKDREALSSSSDSDSQPEPSPKRVKTDNGSP
jgi:hypothetical protein